MSIIGQLGSTLGNIGRGLVPQIVPGQPGATPPFLPQQGQAAAAPPPIRPLPPPPPDQDMDTMPPKYGPVDQPDDQPWSKSDEANSAPSSLPIGAKLGGNAGAPLAPVQSTPSPNLPTPPAPPNTPGGQKIGLGRQIGGALIQGAAMMFPPLIPAAQVAGQKIAQGNYPAQMRAYQQQMAQQQEQAALAKEQAATEEAKQRGKYYGAQADVLNEEGKLKPIVLKDGSIYDPKTHTTVQAAPTIKERKQQYMDIGIPEDQATKLAAGAKFSELEPAVKTIEGRIVEVMSSPTADPTQKQAQINDLIKAHNLLHPTAPIHGFQVDEKGNTTLVVADPANPSAVQKVPLGAIGSGKQQMPGINLTPEAVQFWAQAAAQGVPLPSMGMGASGATARQQIINAAPGASGGTPLVAARATQRADTSSLQAMTKMRDSVVAFENTAKANLDIFSNRAQKVIDSGSPWINTPLRAVNQQGLGSTDLAAFNAARQVALTEIAKVVNNPSLSSVLSDTARKEVLSLVPENATLSQIYGVVQVLRQDMANRKKFLEQGISDIKGRLTGGSGGGGSTSPIDVDAKLKAYADQYFGGDINKAKAAIAQQQRKK